MLLVAEPSLSVFSVKNSIFVSTLQQFDILQELYRDFLVVLVSLFYLFISGPSRQFNLELTELTLFLYLKQLLGIFTFL